MKTIDKTKKMIKYRWAFIISAIVLFVSIVFAILFYESEQYVLAYILLSITVISFFATMIFMIIWLVIAVESSGDTPDPTPREKFSLKYKIISGLAIAGVIISLILIILGFVFSQSDFPFFLVGQITMGIFYIAIIISPSEVVIKEKKPSDSKNSTDLEQQKRDFFSNASHELKTPITSILGFSEMINNNLVSEEEKAAIMQRIEKEARRMSALVADILTISRLESRAALHQRPVVNLTEIVGEAIQAVSPINKGTAITVTTNLEQVEYTADPAHMYDLCVNLVENAVKYNKPHGSVTISLVKTENGIELSVSDSGIGIADEYKTRIFERFYRVDYGRDKRSGGTGLGLSIVKHISGMYNGKIDLDSQLGEGTTITVRFPLA